MELPITRRTVLKAAVAGCAATAAALVPSQAEARVPQGTVAGHMTGARALVEALLCEGVPCVFGIPGRRKTNSGTR